MEPEFIIDEESAASIVHLREAVIAAIEREYELQHSLSQKRLRQKEEERHTVAFLRGLITAKESRCDKLIEIEQVRLAEGNGSNAELQEETVKWLHRLEYIQKAFDGMLEKYGVTIYRPSGRALPDRDDVIDTVSGTGQEPGTIIEVTKHGYLWRGEILRHSEVIIAK